MLQRIKIVDEHRNKSRDRFWDAQGKVFAQIVRNLRKVVKNKMPLMNDFCDLFFMVLYFGIIKMKKIKKIEISNFNRRFAVGNSGFGEQMNCI